MERNTNYSSSDSGLPEIPGDISELVKDIEDREAQRRKAVEIMLERASTAISDDERDMWLFEAEKMEGILDEYKRNMYPEQFKGDT